MSTVEEIESAIETLPPEKVEQVLAWLQARKQTGVAAGKPIGGKQAGFPLFGVLEGKITYREGWDEPLEDFQPYTK